LERRGSEAGLTSGSNGRAVPRSARPAVIDCRQENRRDRLHLSSPIEAP
jgi:hypothetical protein